MLRYKQQKRLTFWWSGQLRNRVILKESGNNQNYIAIFIISIQSYLNLANHIFSIVNICFQKASCRFHKLPSTVKKNLLK